MVKEIEISNTTELLETGQELNAEHYPEVVTATMTDDGQTMTVTVNRNLRSGCVRTIGLYYMMPTYEQQLVTEYEIETFGPSSTVTAATEYVFDISSVMTQLIQPAPEQLADETISIRLYTYESNTPFNYGTCYPEYSAIASYVTGDYVQYGGRLWLCVLASVGNLPTVTKYWNASGVPSSGTMEFNTPYTVSYPSNSILPSSTDGWYALRISDIEEFDIAVQYYTDDIVWYTDGFYNCIADTLGNLPTDVTYWIVMTDEELRNLYEFGHEESNSLATVINSNLLVTRYVKQKHIYELLLKTNYKRYDNIAVVNQLEKLFAMREAAVVHLFAGNPIQARYMLDLITIEVNSYTVNNGEQRVIENITNFTI